MGVPGSAIPLLLASAVPAFNPRDYFDIKLYTGNSSTQTISGLNFSPDFVWLKQRTNAENHGLFDTVRGAQNSLCSNNQNPENAADTSSLTAFTSDGFSLGNTSRFNDSSYAHTAWCFDAGASNVTNTSGTITSTCRANISAGFSIVTYTGTRTSNGTDTIGHGLGVAPELILIKRRDGATEWHVKHKSLTSWQYALILNSTGAQYQVNTTYGTMTAPTSTVFSTSYTSDQNVNGYTYVAYCFAPVAGYSAFGSYTGNGSSTGPVISGLGFQPYFVMIKCSSTTGDWWMYDGARSASNPRDDKLKANSAAAEDTTGEDVDFQSNGFQVKTSDVGLNQNAATYIYAAFA